MSSTLARPRTRPPGPPKQRTPPLRLRECAHCKRLRYCKARKLCYTCYNKPEICQLYPPRPVNTRPDLDGDNVPDFNGFAPLPEAPTDAVPGSPEKVLVMQSRASECRALFHPKDGRASGGEW